MILFDLDMVLCDTTHRRHFIKEPDAWIQNEEFKTNPMMSSFTTNPEWREFISDYAAYDNACDGDEPIKPTIEAMRHMTVPTDNLHIWSSRCESVRDKTEIWLRDNLPFWFCMLNLKMRPIGNTEPAWKLKEMWLDDHMKWPELAKEAPEGMIYKRNNLPDFVFDADPDSIAMWKRRGVFCFDCRQG